MVPYLQGPPYPRGRSYLPHGVHPTVRMGPLGLICMGLLPGSTLPSVTVHPTARRVHYWCNLRGPSYPQGPSYHPERVHYEVYLRPPTHVHPIHYGLSEGFATRVHSWLCISGPPTWSQCYLMASPTLILPSRVHSKYLGPPYSWFILPSGRVHYRSICGGSAGVHPYPLISISWPSYPWSIPPQHRSTSCYPWASCRVHPIHYLVYPQGFPTGSTKYALLSLGHPYQVDPTFDGPSSLCTSPLSSYSGSILPSRWGPLLVLSAEASLPARSILPSRWVHYRCLSGLPTMSILPPRRVHFLLSMGLPTRRVHLIVSTGPLHAVNNGLKLRFCLARDSNLEPPT
ncbi:hypothetical protein FNV43_RR04243 [Rhamnella rubrinervis]|uniref:Uncharacterized protein n=1 Tax=Rhamnella rubrinervis TaxID=2594499 RepID=A0A8K0MPL4_9ROSA|nr:hypothetical protein FNV43_RR04243 [Rhamnella rubrinervis]